MGLSNGTAGLAGGTLTAIATYAFGNDMTFAGETARLAACGGVGVLSGFFSCDHGAAAGTLALLMAGGAAYGGYEGGQIVADRVLREYVLRYGDATPVIEQGAAPAYQIA